MLGNRRRAEWIVASVLVLVMSATGAGEAAQPDGRRSLGTADVGVLGECIGSACGTVVNGTGRGFFVTLEWGAPWGSEAIRWVGPYSRLGGNGIDVDGVHVATGCAMSGVLDGAIYSAFAWGPGWHRIATQETAYVNQHVC